MSYLQIDFQKEIYQSELLLVPIALGQNLPLILQNIDAQLNGGVTFNILRENFKGNKGEIVEFTTNGLYCIPKVLIVGIGDASRFLSLDWQEVGGTLSQFLTAKKISVITPDEWIADVIFGMKLRFWSFDKYKTQLKNEDKKLTFITADLPNAIQRYNEKECLYQGVILARELTAEPANHLFPDAFAKRCLELKKDGIEVKIYDEALLHKMGAEGILSVGKSSSHPSRMVVMCWNGGKANQPYTALVGKGVCYDSGGINLKRKELVEMKFDKAAAASITGVFLTLAKLKIPINVVGVIGLVENMVDGASMRPGDIITMLSGKTVEVVDTDYEGRLVLADCLWYVQENYQLSTIIDLGTLTPETVAPLADEYAGLYCENTELVASLSHAGSQSGEKVWHLPMGANYAKQLLSEHADMKNMGIPGFGEGGAAAEFLKCFIQSNVRWAHLDIAGVAWTLDHYPLNGKGITGFGVRLLLEWLLKNAN